MVGTGDQGRLISAIGTAPRVQGKHEGGGAAATQLQHRICEAREGKLAHGVGGIVEQRHTQRIGQAHLGGGGAGGHKEGGVACAVEPVVQHPYLGALGARGALKSEDAAGERGRGEGDGGVGRVHARAVDGREQLLHLAVVLDKGLVDGLGGGDTVSWYVASSEVRAWELVRQVYIAGPAQRRSGEGGGGRAVGAQPWTMEKRQESNSVGSNSWTRCVASYTRGDCCVERSDGLGELVVRQHSVGVAVQAKEVVD